MDGLHCCGCYHPIEAILLIPIKIGSARGAVLAMAGAEAGTRPRRRARRAKSVYKELQADLHGG